MDVVTPSHPLISMPGDRRYSDDELALLLRRAVEMEADSERPSASAVRASRAGGFTLDEVQGIAAEAGIDPRLVRAAAASIDWAPLSGWARWVGGPAHLRQVFEVPKPLTEGAQPRVLAGIRRATAHHGVVMSEPGALVWRSVGQPTQLDTTLEPGAESTRVTVTADRSGAAALTVFGSFAAWLVAAGVTGAVLEPVGGVGAVMILGPAIAGGALTARSIWSRATRLLGERIARIGREVDDGLTSTSSPRVRSGSGDPTA